MDKKEYEINILQLVEAYYYSREQALKWYDEPHRLIDVENKRTPRQMVENGDGKMVLDWLEMIFR